ncbi:MAG: T9SS type A sorting domain-containing protein [Sphingobacteriales bacterium]|nr:MAG: T9SS type A sorting domain-containing protein [Sphingobacteriales bacterium]
MKKTSLLLGTLILQLTAAYAQETEPAKNVRRVKSLLESRLNDVMKVNELRARDGEETPLAQGRRIVKQESFYTDDLSDPYMFIRYGYTSATKGQEFHPSMLDGFPTDISAGGKSDHVLQLNDLFSDWSLQYNFPIQELGAEIVIDTIGVYDEGDLVHSAIAQRDANNNINVLTKTDDDGSFQQVVKTEKFYTNNLLTKVDEYYGANLSAIELGTTRRITYDNTQKIAADTLFGYNMGVITDTMVFDYVYNSNGDISEIAMYADAGDSGHIAVAYYTDNRYKSYVMSLYSAGALFAVISDSTGYAANGFMAVKKTGNGYNNMGTGLIYEYMLLDLTYNGNLLDSVKVTEIDEMGNAWDGGLGKYHYSIDNNPDSLMISYETGMPADEKVVFHYEPYNTTSVKQVTRNNNFSIYPNPIGATMNVYNKVALKDRKATIMITDIKGARIWSAEQALVQGANQINIPADLSAGTYVISITADNSLYTQKVIKQ